MRKLLLGAAVATFLAGSAAFADETIRATITYVDVQARVIVIDHRAFHIGTEIDITRFKVGQVVTVDFVRVDGQLKVVSVKVN